MNRERVRKHYEISRWKSPQKSETMCRRTYATSPRRASQQCQMNTILFRLISLYTIQFICAIVHERARVCAFETAARVVISSKTTETFVQGTTSI